MIRSWHAVPWAPASLRKPASAASWPRIQGVTECQTRWGPGSFLRWETEAQRPSETCLLQTLPHPHVTGAFTSASPTDAPAWEPASPSRSAKEGTGRSPVITRGAGAAGAAFYSHYFAKKTWRTSDHHNSPSHSMEERRPHVAKTQGPTPTSEQKAALPGGMVPRLWLTYTERHHQNHHTIFLISQWTTHLPLGPSLGSPRTCTLSYPHSLLGPWSLSYRGSRAGLPLPWSPPREARKCN